METKKQEDLERRTEKETFVAIIKGFIKNPRLYWAIGKFALAMSLPRVPESSALLNIYLGAISCNTEFFLAATGANPSIDKYNGKDCKELKRLVKGYYPLEIEIPRLIYDSIKYKLLYGRKERK